MSHQLPARQFRCSRMQQRTHRRQQKQRSQKLPSCKAAQAAAAPQLEPLAEDKWIQLTLLGQQQHDGQHHPRCAPALSKLDLFMLLMHTQMILL